MGHDLNARKGHQLAIRYLIIPTPFHTPVKVLLVSVGNDILRFKFSGPSKNIVCLFKYYLRPFLSRNRGFACV